MQSRTIRTLAVLLAVLSTGAIVAPVGGAIDAPSAAVSNSGTVTPVEATVDGSTGSQTDAGESSSVHSDATIDDALVDETGETKLFLDLSEAPTVNRQEGPEAVIETLKTHAETTQASVVDELDRLDGVTVTDRWWITNRVLVTADLDRVDLERLSAIDGVERIEPSRTFSAPEIEVGTDADAERAEDVTYGLDQLNVTEAWDEFGTTGDGVRVAVASTGVDADHPDIELAEADGWIDMVGYSAEPEDRHGVGTHTAGTLAGGNESGIAIGVAPDVELASARVCDPNGLGCTTQAVLDAFEWAVETDTDVLYVAVSGPSDGQFVDPVYNAMDAGTLVVAAIAGSEGKAFSPGAAYDSVASGATDENLAVIYNSGGKRILPGEFDGEWRDGWPDDGYVTPDLAAPGDAIYSAASGTMCDDPYCKVTGPELSAPHVAGVAAMLYSATDALDPWAVRDVMTESAWKPDDWDPNDAAYYDPDTGRDTRYGAGIVDAHAAVSHVEDRPQHPITGAVTAADGTPLSAARVSIAGASGADTDADGGYELAAFDGNYTLVADAFGYESAEQPVTVDGDGATADFSLDPASDLAVRDGQYPRLKSGETISVTLDAANLQSITVEPVGDYDLADADLTIDGIEADFGESVTFDEPVTGPLEIDVETTPETAGELGLEFVGTGLGSETMADSGPTQLFETALEIEIDETNSPVTAGEVVTVDVQVRNNALPEPETTLELTDIHGSVVETRTVDAPVSYTNHVDFTWETDVDDAGSGAITVGNDAGSDSAPVEVQQRNGTISLGADSAAPGALATVNLSTDIDDVAGYQAEIRYDEHVFEFVEVEGVDLPDPEVDLGAGRVALSSSQLAGVDNATLASLTFRSIGEPGEETELEFRTDDTEVNDEERTIQPDTYATGSLTVAMPCALPGDVDGSGEVTSLDATLTQRYIAGLDPDEIVDAGCGDLNDDGELTPADVTAILQFVVMP